MREQYYRGRPVKLLLIERAQVYKLNLIHVPDVLQFARFHWHSLSHTEISISGLKQVTLVYIPLLVENVIRAGNCIFQEN